MGELLEIGGSPSGFYRAFGSYLRNIAAGSFPSDTVWRGVVFEQLTIEFSYKNGALCDSLRNTCHARALRPATDAEINTSKDYAFRINEILKSFWAECGVTLVDFKLEFGNLLGGTVILADEISPDTCCPVLFLVITAQTATVRRISSQFGSFKAIMNPAEQIAVKSSKKESPKAFSLP